METLYIATHAVSFLVPMKTNPIIEDPWFVMLDLAREAGYDIDRICTELHAAETHQPGPWVSSPDELRLYVANLERCSKATIHLTLNEKPASHPSDRKDPFP
jgi:hypothetical protein